MVQQSNTEPRGTEKTTQGARTHEQQRAVSTGREKTKGVDVDPHQKSLAEARETSEQPAGEFEISHGDRSIQRGAHDESEHRKRRTQ
jgi:hypothetical protein